MKYELMIHKLGSGGLHYWCGTSCVAPEDRLVATQHNKRGVQEVEKETIYLPWIHKLSK